MKNQKLDKEYAKRHAARREFAEGFRYPFGMLTIIDLICGVREANPPVRRKRAAKAGRA